MSGQNSKVSIQIRKRIRIPLPDGRWLTLLVALALLASAPAFFACSSSSVPPPPPITRKQLKTPLATPPPTNAQVTEYQLPSANTYLGAIASGPDGNLWVTECDSNSIARVTLSGAITEFPIPTANTCPQLLTAGPDGNLWFSETNFNTIGRITTAGVITEFPLPPPLNTPSGNTTGIAAGPDGNIWFVDDGGSGGGAIGVMSTSGSLLTFYPTPHADPVPDWVFKGPGGDLWFTEEGVTSTTNYISNITLTGVITEYQIPTPSSNGSGGTIGGVVATADGNVWFTEKVADTLASVTPSGVFNEIAYAAGNYRFQRIVQTPDGNMWFAEESENAPYTSIIAEANSTGGIIADYFLSSNTGTCGTPPYCGLRGMTVGPDSNVWFTDEANNAVGFLKTGLQSAHHARRPK